MADLPTVAISLYLPWGWAILHAGKDIENRSNGSNRRFPSKYLGRCWIHASLWPGTRKPLGRYAQEELLSEFRSVFDVAAKTGKSRDQLPPLKLGQADELRGKILGSIEIVGYVTESESPWFVPGSLGIQVANPIVLATPVDALGALGLWTVPEPVLARLDQPRAVTARGERL